MQQVPPGLRIMPWNAASSPLDAEDNLIPGDFFTPLNKDFFLNLKVQGWWRLRTRFEKTYKAVTQGAKYSYDELISIPSTLENLHVIERELSQAVYKRNQAGKILVDKKPDGAISPNLADAIVICYNPTREVSILDVVW
jgi:phage terminase large subunit